MAQRMNAFSVAPDGLAALVAVEKYLHACGLAPKLLTLVHGLPSLVPFSPGRHAAWRCGP